MREPSVRPAGYTVQALPLTATINSAPPAKAGRRAPRAPVAVGAAARPDHPAAVDGRDALARNARLQRLLDVYGPLLTEHQRLACRLHLDQDWSFSELAEHLGCSRSGAHDLVRRAHPGT